jgi:hypothetical protein
VLKDAQDGPAKIPRVKQWGKVWAMESPLFAIDSDIEPEDQEGDGLLTLDGVNRGVWFTPGQEFRFAKFIGKSVFVVVGEEAMAEADNSEALDEETEDIMAQIDEMLEEEGIKHEEDDKDSKKKKRRESIDLQLSREELMKMGRRELQALAKDLGVNGRQKNQAIVEELLSLSGGNSSENGEASTVNPKAANEETEEPTAAVDVEEEMIIAEGVVSAENGEQ